MKYIERNPKLKRSTDYRKIYFKANKGLLGRFYFCPYCGKIMWNKSKIQVDHIYAVRKVQTNRKLRKRFTNLSEGINTDVNLVACCSRCNKRKGQKGSFWIVLGTYGIYFMPLLRVIIIVTLIFLCLSNFEEIKKIIIFVFILLQNGGL